MYARFLDDSPIAALVFASFRSRPTTHSQRFADNSEIEKVRKLASEKVKKEQLRKWETRKLASEEVKVNNRESEKNES